MEKKFSVYDALTSGLRLAVDNVRLFFLSWLALMATMVAAFATVMALLSGLATANMFSWEGLRGLKQLGQCADVGCMLAVRQAFAQSSYTFLFVTIFIMGSIITLTTFGYVAIALDLYDKGTSSVRRLFYGFTVAPQVLATTWVYLAIVGLGLSAFVFPGVYLAIRFGLWGYIMVDQKTGVIESLKKSYAMTQGASWELLGLTVICTLIGQHIGIGMVVIGPPMHMVLACAYRKIQQHKRAQQPVF